MTTLSSKMTQSFKERLPELKQRLLDYHDKMKTNDGDHYLRWPEYSSDHRFFAVCSYVLDEDVSAFLDHMKKCVDYRWRLYQRVDEGLCSPDNGYVNAVSYDVAFNVLCTQDVDLILKIVTRMEKISITGRKVIPFFQFFFKAFRLLILGRGGTYQDLEAMEERFAQKEKSYVGYPQCFKAIYNQDQQAFLKAFDTLMKGHKRLCTPQGFFGGSEDEVIAFWPLAIVNLARLKGLDVMVDHPLVPKDLITQQLGGL